MVVPVAPPHSFHHEGGTGRVLLRQCPVHSLGYIGFSHRGQSEEGLRICEHPRTWYVDLTPLSIRMKVACMPGISDPNPQSGAPHYSAHAGLNRAAGQHGGGSGARPRPCQPLLAAAVPFSAGATAARPLQSPRICILGGGFGGLNTAVKLDGLVWPEGTKPQVKPGICGWRLDGMQVPGQLADPFAPW